MKIYLAGPMRGIVDFNFPEFNKIEAVLHSKFGHDVFNPARHEPLEKNPTISDFMRLDLPWVCWCDKIAVLKGWEKSEGACIEVTVAVLLGKPVVCAYSLEEIHKLKLGTLFNLTLNAFAEDVHKNACEKGFHDMMQSEREFINEQVCNLHGEVSELHEAWRAGKLHDPCDKSQKMIEHGIVPLTCAEEEYADIIIRALDQCQRLKIDIAGAMQAKHAFNKTREHKHGKLS